MRLQLFTGLVLGTGVENCSVPVAQKLLCTLQRDKLRSFLQITN